MYLFSILLFLTILRDQILARVVLTTCPSACVCSDWTAKCDVTDDTLSTVLGKLPGNLTKLDLSRSGLQYLKNGAFRKFKRLTFLSLADNSLKRLQKGSLQGLDILNEIHLQENGKDFTIEDDVFQDTPSIVKVRLEGNPSITSLQSLRTLTKLQELLVDSPTSCTRCNYTRSLGNERCRSPEHCTTDLPRESPFAPGDCACALCTPLKSRMDSRNCSKDHLVGSRLLGDSTTVRVVLWLISTSALVSNLALIVSRCYTHTLRQKPLGIFIVGIALSNLFVTTSVLILLVADLNQSPEGSTVLGPGYWSQSVCGPVYFLKHFGIYSLVFILSFVVMQRFIKLGYHRCFTTQLTVRRSVMYVCEAWVLSFLFIIMPWTRVTTWHRMCTASHETTFARAMYFISSCLVIGLCFTAVVQVGILFRRHMLADNLSMRKETRADLGLILAAVLTLLLLGIPHGVMVIRHFVRATFPKTGVEIVTILLTLLCALYPVLLARYYPTVTCLSDTLSSSNTSCTCGKCKVDQFYPTKYSLDSLHPPKSTVTLSSFQGGSDTQKRSTTVTSTASVERMSADSLVELDSWNSRTTKTKSWVEACDYDDLKKLQAQTTLQAPNLEHCSCDDATKPRALTWSNGNSTSTSVVNGVFSTGSASTSSERTSSFREAIHEHALLRPVPHEELATGNREDPDCGTGKTSDSRKKSRRLSSFKELVRALSPRRQRSKSLPENWGLRVNKFERSQSAPFTGMTLLDKNSPAPVDRNSRAEHPGIAVRVNPENLGPSGGSSQEMARESRNKERLATFFILAPAKSPKVSRMFSPRKTKMDGGVASPSSMRGSSITDRIAKSFSLGCKSPSQSVSSPSQSVSSPSQGATEASPAKTITLEEGDILTELPVVRRQKLRTKPRDPTTRDSSGSTGSGTIRFSLEWDPIGSVEGYAEREVLPPYPPVTLDNNGVPHPPKFPKPLVQAPTRASREILGERNSSYSLDWDPTSVQLRNSMISRDSLSCVDSSDSEGSMGDVDDHEDTKGTTVWV